MWKGLVTTMLRINESIKFKEMPFTDMLNSWLKAISQKAKNAILTAFIYLSKSTRDYIYLLLGTQSPQTSTAQVSLSTFHFT